MPSQRSEAARAASVGALLLALALAAPAHAQAPLRDRAYLSVGPFLADSSVRVALAPDAGTVPEPLPPGPAEGELRESRRTLRWDAGVAIGERHALRVGGFRVEGEADGSTTRLLEDEGREVVVDASARGDLRLDVQGASWTWWTDGSREHAAGFGLGVVRYALRTRVEGVVVVDGGPPGEGEGRYSEDAIAPVLRLEYRRRLGDAWRLGVEVAWVRKPNGPLNGDATEAALGFEWLPYPHFGLGLRYAWADLDLRFERSAGIADLSIRNRGPQLLASWRY